MTSSSNNYSKLELQLGQALVATAAPEEMEYFDEIAAAPKPSGKKRDHTLGFGLPAGEVGTISAAILVLCKPILAFIWDNACDAAGQLIKDASDQARTALEKRLGEWFTRHFKKPKPVTIPPDKLEEFIGTLKSNAASLNLDEDAFARLTAALRTSLQQ